MKALSIRAPWAYLIQKGYKQVENRTRRTNFRGDFLIHVGKTFEGSEAVLGYIQTELWNWGANLAEIGLSSSADDYQLGGFIAVATLEDCKEPSPELLPFEVGPFCYHLDNIKPIEFIPALGKQGFFNVSDELVKGIKYLPTNHH